MARNNGLAGRGLTIGAFLLSVPFLAGGLIFLCAAVENAARFPLALVLLVLGAGLAAWAGLRWRKTRQRSPDILEARIIDLAAANDAELSVSRLMGALDLPEEVARTALARLEAKGLCQHRFGSGTPQEQRAGKSIYVFPGLKDSKVVRRCAYCGNQYSVREALHKCPNCGGSLEIVKT